MTKRAIYLDERERDLARRVFAFAVSEARGRLERTISSIDEVALEWTRDEINALFIKFEEPSLESIMADETDPT